MQVSPYLFFDGDCEEAFRLYETVLGGKIVMMLTHADSPMADQMPPELQKTIMHARLEVRGQAIMGSDAPPDRFHKPQGFSVSLAVDTAEDAERVFAGLSEGGTLLMPLQETFWAIRFGMTVDRFGTPWMINCEKKAA